MNGSASAAKSRVRRRDVRATPTRWSRTSRLTCRVLTSASSDAVRAAPGGRSIRCVRRGRRPVTAAWRFRCSVRAR